jgi:hypothetical protein
MFVYFLMFTMALQREGLGPDYVIGAVEEIQPQYAMRCSSFPRNDLIGFQAMVAAANEFHPSSNSNDSPKRPQSCCCRIDADINAECVHDAGAKRASVVRFYLSSVTPLVTDVQRTGLRFYQLLCRYSMILNLSRIKQARTLTLV